MEMNRQSRMIEFKKISIDSFEKPGWWLDDKLVVWARCPNGHIGTLEDHDIKVYGVVYPSMECMHEGCDFHGSPVKLLGWNLGEYLVEQIGRAG